jgi:hypothetical protein
MCDGDDTGLPSHWGLRPPRLHRMELSGCGGAVTWKLEAPWPPGCCDRQPVKALWTPWQGFRRTKLEASGASGCRLKNSVLTNKYRKEDKKRRERKEKKRKGIIDIL